jgi:hypothetical protein
VHCPHLQKRGNATACTACEGWPKRTAPSHSQYPPFRAHDTKGLVSACWVSKNAPTEPSAQRHELHS